MKEKKDGLQHRITSLILWCSLLAIYLFAVATIGLGVVLTGKEWWHTLETGGTRKELLIHTFRFGLCVLGFTVVVVQPLIYIIKGGRAGSAD